MSYIAPTNCNTVSNMTRMKVNLLYVDFRQSGSICAVFLNHLCTGSYAFVEASKGMRGDSAVLVSLQLLPANIQRCLVFWYYMYGAETGSLVVERWVCCFEHLYMNLSYSRMLDANTLEIKYNSLN